MRIMKATTTLTRLLVIALVAGVATTGCASKGTLSSREVAPARQTAVRVRNDNWNTVRVYLVREVGSTVRLATVPSMTTQRIPLRGAVASELRTHGTLRFLIRPLGSNESFVTHSILAGPDDVMRLIVATRLRFSTLVVGNR